jgi:hypothetical protein
MSWEEFDDNCPGCRPAILDLETGKALPEEHPLMVKMAGVWATTSLAERRAWHRVTCLNSRDNLDLLLAENLVARFKAAAEGEN